MKVFLGPAIISAIIQVTAFFVINVFFPNFLTPLKNFCDCMKKLRREREKCIDHALPKTTAPKKAQ